MGAVTQLHAPAANSSSDQVHHPDIANDDEDDKEEHPEIGNIIANDDDDKEKDRDKGLARKVWITLVFEPLTFR